MSFCETRDCQANGKTLLPNEAKAHKRNFPSHEVVAVDKSEKDFEEMEMEAGL